jgi:hypothetical protein
MRIECERCADVVEVTDRSVVAPFLCAECSQSTVCNQADGWDHPDTGIDQRKLIHDYLSKRSATLEVFDPNKSQFPERSKAPTKSDYDTLINTVGKDCSDCTYPDCDTATIENTTLLIEDLQQQLAAERANVAELRANIIRLASAALSEAVKERF